jgi:CHAT domain-containing protein/Flp pilus assembly protein TadD
VISPVKRALRLWPLIATLGLAPKPTPTPAPPEGILVEKVVPGYEAAKAGIRPGDILVGWERAPNPPADPSGARGRFRSPFDVLEVITEQAPRSRTMSVDLERDGRRMSAPIGQFSWRLDTRPLLADAWLSRHEEGRRAFEQGDREKGATTWRALAADLAAANRHLEAAWLWWFLATRDNEARQTDAAIASCDAALVEARAAGRRDVEAQLWSYKVEYLRSASRDKEAAAAAREALAIRESMAPESLSVARCLYELASVTDNNSTESVALHRRALGIRERIAPGSSVESASLAGLGVALGYQGDMRAQIELLRRALAINQTLDPGGRTVGRLYSNLCAAYMNRGDVGLAEDSCRQSLTVWQSLGPGEREGVRQSLHNLAIVTRLRGDYPGSVALLLQEKELCDQIAPEGPQAVWNRFELAVDELEQGNLDRADEYFRESERLMSLQKGSRSADSHAAASATLRADLAYRRKDLAASEKLLRTARSYYERTAPTGYASVTTAAELGLVLSAQGNTKEAEEWMRSALSLRQIYSPDSVDTAQSHHDLGMLYWKNGRLDEAQDELRRAVEDLEAQQEKIGSDDSQSTFRSRHGDIYKDYIEFLSQRKRDQDAFRILEQYRAATFLKTLSQRDLAFEGEIPPDLERDRNQINEDYERLQGQLRGLDPKLDARKIEEGLAKLSELRHRRDDIAGRIRSASPRLAALRYPQPLDAAAAARALDPGTVMLSYCVGRTQTLLFVLDADRGGKGLSIFILPVGEADLRESIRALRRLIDTKGDSEARDRRAKALFDVLVAPAAKRVGGSQRILVVPDGPLHVLPWAALVRGVEAGRPQYLMAWKPLTTVLSATVFAQIKSGRETSSSEHPIQLAAFGDPTYPALTRRPSGTRGDEADPSGQSEPYGEVQVDAALRGGYRFDPLPYTREEVEEIAALWAPNARTYLGDAATEERAVSFGKDVSHFHYACHAYVNERFPLDSALVLSIPEKPVPGRSNGLLQAWEILEKVRIDADLVTLSACDSGLGKEMGGEGLVGLTRAFQFAGARSVLASLWKVEDASTAALMTGFYKHLKAGRPKDEALRLAQLDMVRSARYSSPRDWAAFQVSGDWK